MRRPEPACSSSSQAPRQGRGGLQGQGAEAQTPLRSSHPESCPPKEPGARRSLSPRALLCHLQGTRAPERWGGEGGFGIHPPKVPQSVADLSPLGASHPSQCLMLAWGTQSLLGTGRVREGTAPHSQPLRQMLVPRGCCFQQLGRHAALPLDRWVDVREDQRM